MLTHICQLFDLSADRYFGEPQAWSKFKQFLRAAKARSKEALDQAVAEALKTITADNAAAWFRHCGYGIQRP